MQIIAYPPFDTLLGAREITLPLRDVTLWEVLQSLAREHPDFGRELPREGSDEALRSRLLPVGNGRVYSVRDRLPADAKVKLFPPVAGG
ncbi:MAG: sulfur-carrier protein [Bacillota bacterium]|nr:sulfur-carrier protein [Bacillota bacterium]MDK2856305.1 sulfur-carrier protein [Bacillota bacterium]MDK2925597.1 sulfur-carrier protein [Bacillota bacterium]